MDVGLPARIRKLPFEEGSRRGTRRGNEMTSALARDQRQISPKDIRFFTRLVVDNYFSLLPRRLLRRRDRFPRSRLSHMASESFYQYVVVRIGRRSR